MWEQEESGSIVNRYGNENQNMLLSTEIEMPNDSREYKLSFTHTPYTEGVCDIATVVIGVEDEDGNWNMNDIAEYYEGDLMNFHGFFDENSCPNQELITSTYNLSSFAGKTIQIAFMLMSDEDYSSEDGAGYYWLLDEVRIACVDYVLDTEESTTSHTAVFGTEAGIVVSTAATPSTVAVYNTMGSLVANKEVTDNISLISMPSGMYIVIVDNKSYKVVVK